MAPIILFCLGVVNFAMYLHHCHILSLLILLECLVILGFGCLSLFCKLPLVLCATFLVVVSVTVAAAGLSITTYSTRSSTPTQLLSLSSTW